ncbi:hypothetical protein HID58_056327 [Brassica napus]|uniref:Uncharacterized protein n=1 Tax=Brassica napus TaxID=3708 RepID=A0ABQ8AN50_BRANA|nr:hypothetical protein HID58_056327 [Brassica napus]
MISRRWNPGIWGFYEIWISQSVVNLRWLGLGKWYLIWGKLAIWILISLLIKTESNPYRGIVALSFRIINQGSGVSASSRKGNRDGFDVEIIWGLCVLRLTREEGEIRSAEERVATIPSQKFQEELAKTQADGIEAISDPTDAEQGLVTVQGMLEDQGELDDEDVMDMDEIKAHLLENGIDMDAEDFMENLSEGVAEEVIKESNGKEEEEVASVEEEQGQIGGGAGKKQGLRKCMFKPTLSTVGSSKMRVFNALASPRKRAGAKTGTRQGDTNKQTEIKGHLNPKSGHQKT